MKFSVFQKKGRFRYFYTLLLLLTACFSRAQSCTSCSITISGHDTLAYTLNAGQTLCIDSAGRFEGTITLNGGTICNRGIFSPKNYTVSTGIIFNYSCLSLNSDLTLGTGLSLTNEGTSTATILGDMTISGGTLNNAGISSIADEIVFSSGTFDNSAIVSCKTLTGDLLPGFSNSGIISKD